MPVPKPNSNESMNAFMGRCMKMMVDENKTKSPDKRRPQKQMVAICMNQFKGGNMMGKASAEIEQNTEAFVQQFLEKYPEYKPYFENEAASKALKVNKSASSMSDTAWGSVDKTALMHSVTEASNAGSLVHDVYMLVESGWEGAPSEHLKYPVMELKAGTLVYNRAGLGAALQRASAQNETSVVSKIHGIYKKLGIKE